MNVDLYNPDDPADGPNYLQRNLPFDRGNHIEVVDEARARQLERRGAAPHRHGFRSNVRDGDEGEWRGFDRSGVSVLSVSDASHEFGHLLGFRDRYVDLPSIHEGKVIPISSPRPGWEGNIMAEGAGRGTVDQGMIDRLVAQHVAHMNASGRDAYRTGIDTQTSHDRQL